MTNDERLLNAEESKYFRDLPPNPTNDAARAELVQLTCAALTGLFATPLIETPTGFAKHAVRIALETQQQINNHFEPKE